MIKVKRFENELMCSNCYIVYDDVIKECLIIDPGSRESNCEIEFVKAKGLSLIGILLTHEHSDHTWGVNALLDAYPKVEVIVNEKCFHELPSAGDMYFRLYYNDPTYHYEVRRVDRILKQDLGDFLMSNFRVEYFSTPGHSPGSICYVIDKYIFTGDSYMPDFKLYINKKNGDKTLAKASEETIKSFIAQRHLMVCPGHGTAQIQ